MAQYESQLVGDHKSSCNKFNKTNGDKIDIVGTLEIENTDYKVPIVQGDDNKWKI